MANIYQTGGKAVGKALSKLKSKGAPKAAKAITESYQDKILGYTKTNKPIYAGPNEITQSYSVDDYQTAWAVKENERLNILTNISSLPKNSKELQARQEKLGSLEESMKQEFTPSYEDREKKYALDAIGNRSIGSLRERQNDLAVHFMENPVIPWDELSPEIKDSLRKQFNRPGEIYNDKNATEKYERRRTQLSQKQPQQATSPAPTTEQPTTPKETPPKPKLKEETALATTPGAKLSRVEPVTESEYIPPPSPEERRLLPAGPGTALVPAAPKRTTFIAGERGISAGEPERVLGPTREMAVFSEPGPFQERIRDGLTAPRPQANDIVADRISASQKLNTTQKVGAGMAVAGATGMATRGEDRKEEPTGPGILARPPEETPPIPEKEKPAIVKPAPPLGGVSTTEPSAQVKATKATVPGQVQTVQTAKTGVDSLKEKLLSGAPLGRGDLLSVLKEIEQIKPEAVTKDTTLINQLKAAREDARTAYREQANRNEWYEVAQTLGNAVANFIAAQRGVADRALALPQIDYGERTGRALREYQTELGSIGEQEQALERGTEKQIAAAERAAETSRRSWEKYLALGEKQVEAAERKAERDKDLATKVALAKADDERSLKVATAKAEEKKQEAAKSNAKDYLSAVKSQVSLYDNQIEDAQRKLKAAQTFSTTDQKNFNKNFQEYMTSLSTEKVPVTEESYQAKGFFGGTSFKPDLAKKDAAARVKELTDRVSTLNQKKNAAVAEEAALLEGRTTTPPAQAGQAPASGGKVVTKAELSEYAKKIYGGNEEAAKQYLTSQGFSIGN